MSKLITILGNTGKSTLAFFLGNSLIDNGKRVMIISTDNSIPTLQYMLPEDKKTTRSLGRLLSLALISDKDILDNMQTIRGADEVGYLSYASGENKNTYPEITQGNLGTFFELLRGLVDYIIIDTQTILNEIDRYALLISDINICVCSANIKGLAYRQNLSEENITHVLLNDNVFNPYEDIAHTYKQNVKYHIPFLKNLQSLYNLDTFVGLICPPKYIKIVDKIVTEVIDVE